MTTLYDFIHSGHSHPTVFLVGEGGKPVCPPLIAHVVAVETKAIDPLIVSCVTTGVVGGIAVVLYYRTRARLRWNIIHWWRSLCICCGIIRPPAPQENFEMTVRLGTRTTRPIRRPYDEGPEEARDVAATTHPGLARTAAKVCNLKS